MKAQLSHQAFELQIDDPNKQRQALDNLFRFVFAEEMAVQEAIKEQQNG
jgi:hypothetical protein